MATKNEETGKPETITTNFGAPLPSNEHSLTAGERGPVLLQDVQLIEKLAHFDRERIPERVVHAKGAGAFGTFEATADMSRHTRAHLFGAVGRQTPVLVRFSTVGGEKGSADADRDPRGFAIKFYTDEGNYDLVGNNTPVFFIRDPFKFPDMVHTHKRNPQSNLKDPDAFWDFFSRSPESLHMVTVLFSDRGIPRSYRQMHGFGSHTYSWVNAAGERFWVKYHWKTVQGIENLDQAEADALTSLDPDYHRRDLWNAIAAGDAPEWRLEMQIMPFEEAADYRFNPFDLTKVWPHADYPPITVGRFVLDRNPVNHFAEVEQAAFSVGSLVPGIGLSPDKMLMGRVFSYHDTHLHRIGPNYEQLPINAAKAPVNSYMKDGPMTYRHAGRQPVYAPNSYGGPKADSATELPAWMVEAGEIGRYAYDLHAEDDDFGQAGTLVRDVMDDTDRDHLASNIIGHASKEVSDDVQRRVIAYWTSVDADIGARVAAGLGHGNGGGARTASAISEPKVQR